MSMYGDDEKGNTKEYLYFELREFLSKYPTSELLRLVADVVEAEGD